MCMLVKQLGANKQGQVIMVLRTFLDFMFSFKSIKTHNMVALILDPQFKNLNLAVDYVGHSFAIKIVATCDKQFLFPTLKTLYYKFHGGEMQGMVTHFWCHNGVFC